MILEDKTFDNGSVQLHYVEGGCEARPLLLLHGGAWCWQEFLPLMPVLGARHHLYALDLRGHGRSGHTPGHYRLVDFADDVISFLRQQNGGPTVIQGHSVGAVVAILVAARCPELVKALVLEEPALSLDTYGEVVAQNRAVYAVWSALAGRPRSALELARELADSVVEGAGRFGDLPGVTPDWLLFLGLCLRGLDPTFLTFMLDHYADFLAGYEPARLLPKLTCPTLLLHGESRLGGILSPQAIEEGRALLPQGAWVVGYEGLGHELHMANSEPIARTVTRFLEML